jgi:hypothetical protein
LWRIAPFSAVPTVPFTTDQAQAIFARVGLTGPFWELPR